MYSDCRNYFVKYKFCARVKLYVPTLGIIIVLDISIMATLLEVIVFSPLIIPLQIYKFKNICLTSLKCVKSNLKNEICRTISTHAIKCDGIFS